MAEKQKSHQVAWDDESLNLSDLVFFKGEKDRKKRIFIMSPNPTAVRVHYKDEYFLCLSKYALKKGKQCREELGKCCELLGEPKVRFGTVVVVYDTTKEGTARGLYKKNPEEMEYELMIWTFGPKVFQNLKNKHVEWDITTRDLLISCTNEQYQNIEIDVMKTSWVKGIKELGEKIKRDYDLFRHKDPLPYLGKVMSRSDIVLLVGAPADPSEKAEVAESAEIKTQEFDQILNELNDDAAAEE